MNTDEQTEQEIMPLPFRLEDVAEMISHTRAELEDWFAENGGYLYNHTDEAAFIEICAQFNLSIESHRRILGELVQQRLDLIVVSEKDDEARGQIERSTLAYWSDQIGMEYGKLYRLVQAARNRSLVPEIESKPITYQAEIGRDVPESEDKEKKIRERTEQVESLDPEGKQSVALQRTVRGAEKVGIRLFRVEHLEKRSEDQVVITLVGQGASGKMTPFMLIIYPIEKDESTTYYQEAYRRMIRIGKTYYEQEEQEKEDNGETNS